jgi:hypothetical protein
LIHRDESLSYKNFFILLIDPEKPFEYCASDGVVGKRKSTKGWSQDFGVLLDEKFYIDPNETQNGFYKIDGNVVKVSDERFKERYRYLVPFAMMIVPTETATACMNDRKPTGELIRATIEKKTIDAEDLRSYLNATRSHHSTEITKWN